MANKSIWVVQGFQVDTFVVKKDEIKLTLKVSKDDLRAQDGDIGDILTSLEMHSSGEVPVEITLGRCDVGSSD